MEIELYILHLGILFRSNRSVRQHLSSLRGFSHCYLIGLDLARIPVAGDKVEQIPDLYIIQYYCLYEGSL